jgi:hypothetical protein
MPTHPPVALPRAVVAPSRCVRTRPSKAAVLHLAVRIVRVLFLCLVAVWWVESGWWENYVLKSPLAPNASTGQTAPVSYKGGTFFVERRWRELDGLFKPGVAVLAIALMVAGLLIDRAAKHARHAENQRAEGDVYAVCPECLGQGSGNPRNVCTYCLGTGFADIKVKR